MRHHIDWYKHYKEKLHSLQLTADDIVKVSEQDKAFLEIILSCGPKKIIELGCGLARDSFVLAQSNIDVTALDIDPRIISLGTGNAKKLNLPVKFVLGDFFKLSSLFASDSFDLAFHSGTLEHFEDKDIGYALAEQLKVSRRIVFSVPIQSESNDAYFKDKLYRRLLPMRAWEKILSEFNVKNIEQIHGRHDDIVAVIER